MMTRLSAMRRSSSTTSMRGLEGWALAMANLDQLKTYCLDYKPGRLSKLNDGACLPGPRLTPPVAPVLRGGLVAWFGGSYGVAKCACDGRSLLRRTRSRGNRRRHNGTDN